MFKKILFCFLNIFVINSLFVLPCFADDIADVFKDNLEINTVPSPTVSGDGRILEDEPVTDFNDDFYNENVDNLEDEEVFDEKQDYSSTLDISDDSSENSSAGTEDNVAIASVEDDEIAAYSEDDISVASNDGIEAYSADAVSYTFPNGWNGEYKNSQSNYLFNVTVPASAYLSLYNAYIEGVDSSLNSGYEELLSYDNFFLFKSSFDIDDGSYVFYKIIFCDDDVYYYSSSDSDYYYYSDSSGSAYLLGCVGFFGSKNSGDEYMLYCRVNKSTYYDGFTGGGYIGSGPFFIYDTDVLLYSSHDLYIDSTLIKPNNPDGTIYSDIKGTIEITDSYMLNYTAYTDTDITKEFDVTMFALDNASCPAKINDSLTYPYVNMERYLEAELVITPSKKKVSGSFGLESAYYYLHQMKAYDDSVESVYGYEFDTFDSTINIMYALAYREKDTTGDWIVLMYTLYDYTDIIENVMGDFTIKKDYEDFPDMSDYLEDFESWDDVAADCADENGEYNVIEVTVKWIGRNLLHMGNNFIGFFDWLFDCIPVLWDNLTIALYNLVCDLKSLFLYLFDAKTKAIFSLANERIPGFSDLQSAISGTGTSELPSFTLFGTKFSLDLSDYDIDFSYVRSISSVLIYIIYLFAVWNLIISLIAHSNARQGGD